MGTAPALRAFEHHLLAYRRIWRGTAFFSFANPVLFLTAMGLGLGSLVDRGTHAGIGPAGYVSFLAPGLLAASAMQLGANEAMWPVMGAMKWQKIYFAQVATPLRPADAAAGHLLFMALRVAIAAAVFLVVMVAFGAVHSAWALLAFPAAVLCGMAHAAPIAAFSASRQSEGTAFASLNRFVLTPLFLFSGTFFPVTQLPAGLRPVAWFTPLWHGVSLCRGLTLGSITAAAALGHAAYLGAWVALGTWAAVAVYTRRLTR